MTRSDEPRKREPRDAERRRVPYALGYGLTAGVLLAVTVALVVIVLPSRYALIADLRESGISFPTSVDAVGFQTPGREPLIEPPPPPPEPELGPAEAMWIEVDSLLAAGAYQPAVARMEAYLEEHPYDFSVHRARAHALAAAGRPAAARAAFEELARMSGAPDDRLALARLLRDAGEVESAIEQYRVLIAARPDDLELRHELARLYMWRERHSEAIAELRRLVAMAPEVGRYRLDLARALYWNDRLEEARAVLAGMPASAPETTAAAELDDELARLLTPPPEPEPEPLTLVEQARAAAAADDFGTARELYDRARAEAPADSAVARERIDFLQYRQADLEAAISALEAYEERFGLDADSRYRLGELYVWTDRQDDARRHLEALVRDEPDRADAWGLLGDVYRYADERGAARDAYERALVLEPEEAHSMAGIPELDRLRSETIASREQAGLGPSLSLFSDSDDFLRLDLGAGARWTGSTYVVGLDAGWRRLEGRDLLGQLAEDEGAFATLEVARWWSEASVRTALWLGADHLDAAGTEPMFGLSVERFGRTGAAFGLRYEHGPGYPLTYTLESASAQIVADRLEVSASAPVGADWSVSAAADLARLSGDEPTNTRWGGGVTVARRLGPWLTADVGSRLLGFTDPAPAPGRRLYWDPSLFWSNTLGVSLGQTPQTGLGYRFRLSGGAAWADERDVAEAGWIPQYGAEAGLTWRSDRTTLDLGTFYRSGREDEYNSFGGELTLRIRP
ncbi:MAG TPA: tetratricopeptide repeat protein [Gemmatimonadota bacterium]|nr:tetratricopeptide repeat protein [Gemmatimonadota bacterium]